MITRFRRLHRGTIALAGLLVVGCTSTPTVHSNTDPTANLSSYKTYGFVPQPGTNRGGYSTPLTTNFEMAISRELDARGYRKVDTDPDLLVNFNANSKENVDLRSTYTPGPYYYGYRGGMYGGVNDVQTVRYKVGTANIDIVDANKKRLVWEGVAEGELTQDMMKNPQAAVDMVVAQMFMQFAGKAAL